MASGIGRGKEMVGVTPGSENVREIRDEREKAKLRRVEVLGRDGRAFEILAMELRREL